MVPASPDTPSVNNEFDLDLRLGAVRRHMSDDSAEPPSQGCPDGPTNITCHPQGGCSE